MYLTPIKLIMNNEYNSWAVQTSEVEVMHDNIDDITISFFKF